MKKLLTLGLAAGMIMAASAPASAVDVKMDGTYNFQYDWAKSYDSNKSSVDFQWQYVDIGATFTASEALSGYFQVRGFWQWGNTGLDTDELLGGASPAGRGADLFVRQAYIDWLVPGTALKVRMGRQLVAAPAMAVGKNTAFWNSDPMDGISASYKFNDMFSLAGYWLRLGRITGYTTGDSLTTDIFGLNANVKFDGFAFQPWLAYAHGDKGAMAGANGTNNNPQGNGHNHVNNTWWAGINGQLTMFDPLTVKADFVYGDRDYRGHNASQHGWVVDGMVSYKTPYGTPALYAWYGSGDSKKTQNAGDKMLPSISGRNNVSMGFFNGVPFYDNMMCKADGNNHTIAGTWGIKLAMEGISFLQDLSHTVQVVYAGGTNDGRNGKVADQTPWKYMTEKDQFLEFDFLTTYKVYKNLSLGFAVAYIIEDFQTQKGTTYDKRASSYDNGWGMALNVQYKF